MRDYSVADGGGSDSQRATTSLGIVRLVLVHVPGPINTAHRERLRDCVRVVGKEDLVLAIGVNCTAPELIAPLIEEIRSESEKPIVVYPNSGQKWNAADRCWVGKQHAED